MLITIRFKGHLRQNTDSKSQFYVGLDDIGIDRGQYHIRGETLGGECLINFCATGEGEVVGDDGVLNNILQR